jgi:hypothetical protein
MFAATWFASPGRTNVISASRALYHLDGQWTETVTTADGADVRGLIVLYPRNQRHPRLMPPAKACFDNKPLQVRIGEYAEQGPPSALAAQSAVLSNRESLTAACTPSGGARRFFSSCGKLRPIIDLAD